MKNRRIKQIITSLFFTTLLLGLTGVTFSYFQNTGTMTNEFQAGDYSTSATESFVSPTDWKPGDTTEKTLIVKNEGDIAQGVRIKIEESWKDSNDQDLPLEVNGVKTAIINFDNTDDWERDGEYYYYKHVLDPGDETSSFIESVTFNKDIVGDPVCTTTNGITSCTTSYNGYEDATYTLTFIIQTIQYEFMDPEWDEDKGTLYAIVRDEYRSNSGYAGIYTGAHKDSYDRDPSKKIYYFTIPTANDVTQGNNLLNKVNVIFAGFCWQILRTTDTGGVKMIYNGVPLDGKCTNNTTRDTNGLIQGARTTNSMNASYAYGSDFTYDLDAKTFKIDGTIKENINYSSDKSVIGYYTCKNVDKNATCQTLYYLQEESATNASPYVYPFTINSTNYAQIGTTPYNTQDGSPAYVGYMYNKAYDYKTVDETTSQNHPITSNTFGLSSYSPSTSYWYADSINFGASSYELVNPYQVTSTSDYPSLVGKYTFRDTSQTGKSSTVLYIIAVHSNFMIYKEFYSANISSSYYYGDAYDYGETTEGKYTITNKTQWSNGVDVTGKYVTYGVNNNSIYYVLGKNGNRIFYDKLFDGNKLRYNDTIVFGDSISDNHNGTYSLNNPTQPISLAIYTDYYSNDNLNFTNYEGKYTCGNSSTTCKLPRYITSTTYALYSYLNPLDQILISKTRNGLTLTDTLLVNLDELANNYSNYSDYKYTCNTTSNICTEDSLRMITGFTETGYSYAVNRYFGESATWNGSSYTLNNTVGVESATNLTDISSHHYTCIDPIGTTCPSVGYIYNESGKMYYILLENGVETVEDALTEMLYEYNVGNENKLNTKESAIKRLVEEWYYNNLRDYDSYLEETIYCNDRSIRSLGGWKDDGGSTSSSLQFKEYYPTRDLSCSNDTDQFSVLNSSAKLKYKIGLASGPEMNLLNNHIYSKTGVNYWLADPYSFYPNGAHMRYVDSVAYFQNHYVIKTYGARPAVSLNSGTVPTSGSGTMDDPYVIDTN